MTPQEATAALHHALLTSMDITQKPDLQLIEKLIAAGADVNATDDDGLSALLRCLSWPCPPADHPLHREKRNRVTMAVLINGADLDAHTPNGQSVRALATSREDERAALNLLECEILRRSDPRLMAEVSYIQPWWPKPGTPANDDIRFKFFVACNNNWCEQIKYWLYLYPDALRWQRDVSTGRMPDDGNALMIAVHNAAQALDCVTLLIARGIDVNWQNSKGMTALHYAVSLDQHRDHFIAPLIDAGANEKLRNNDGLTAIELANINQDKLFSTTLSAAIASRDAGIAQRHSATLNSVQAHKAASGAKFRL